MIKIKTLEEIELMRESALIVSKTLGMLASEVKPGVTTLQLDGMAETFIRDHGAVPGFLGLYDFPNSLCMSPNAQVVHGIPNNTPLVEGDIISIDCGALKNGFYGDHAYTFEVGEVDAETKKLLQVTKESLYVGIREFKIGNRVGDVGYAIQQYTESRGYGVVRELVGHGLGREMHEDPEMPNYGKRGRGKKFVEGMVVAIEPMINLGTRRIKQLKDGWTILTADNKPSAHFEHDVAIIDG
ncbi:MAG TPA: type I methionyl aminopeptidase, partial [Arenibacter sp.]|nr:type I methionyl aminopeptidase [Arenibacter sp.]